jgi:type IV pilus assembly protein PilY1
MRKRDFLGITLLMVALAGVVALVATGLPPANAGTCDFPLFIQQGGVDANVMILFDSSASMNEGMWHDDYNPNIAYTGGLNRNTTYSVANDGLYSPRSFRNGLPTNPKVTLVDSDQGRDGDYSGNYLNWIFYHATATQRAAVPRFTRIQVAKDAVEALLGAAGGNIRFGMYKFNGDNGGTRIADLGTDTGTIITTLNNIEGDAWTPLGETLAEILEYFDDPGIIQYECQKNFAVVVTDGYPTQDDDNCNSTYSDCDLATCTEIGAPYDDSYDCSDYIVDVARYMRENDLVDSMDGQQYVVTYTVGMNVDAPVLSQAADAGDGEYFSADNAAEIAESLDRVLRDIMNRISAGSAVAVVSTEGEAEDLLYRGKFQPANWAGYLEAFELPYEAGEAPVWEAGSLLSNRAPSSRTIFTSSGANAIDFTSSNAGTLRPLLGAATDAAATNLINWVRGEAVAGFRDRLGWLLGDIVDSAPVPVGPPSSFYLYNDYLDFRDGLADRERVIYVSANDAMVHCFQAETGEELWAYIPGDQLDRLDDLASTSYCHEYFVNATPRVVDCYLGGEWKTVLVAGQKQGGAAYFALDVTDPRNPEFMWETVIPEVSESWAQVEVARVESVDKFVGFVGSGYNSSGEAYLIGFDMEDGSVIWKDLLSDNGTTNMATSCTAVDLEFDGWDDLVYVADLTGNLYRFDLKPSTPTKSVLFSTPGQPIQAQPIVTVDYDNSVYIYFGTGKYVDPADMSNTSDQAFYCVIDNHSGSSIDINALVNQTGSINTVSRGWYFDLGNAHGERATETAALVAGIVYFTSFAPNDEPCQGGGTSWLYAAKFRNGATHDDDDDDSNDTAGDRSDEIGDGITARPVIDIVNEKVLVQGSDTRIHVRDTIGEIRQLIVRSYRQQY